MFATKILHSIISNPNKKKLYPIFFRHNNNNKIMTTRQNTSSSSQSTLFSFFNPISNDNNSNQLNDNTNDPIQFFSSSTTVDTEDNTTTSEGTTIESPLDKLKSISFQYGLCDKDGFRKKDKHWTFSLSIVDWDGTAKGGKKKAPILRTVNLQRVSEKGIDFVMKNRGHGSDLLFVDDQYMSFLYTFGKYLPGQKVEQWRAQGLCQPIRLQEIISYVQPHTIVEMVASVRANKEGDSRSDMDYSHFVELVQQTRLDLDNDEVSMMELEEAVRGWRFVPIQVERMVGGPDQMMWDRSEWVREGDHWVKPHRLMPF